ncbi:putative phage abortive infection protein [Pseudoalteromonas rhizosphaerae]|uniref:putative phage abortive infection protein n=1 Tax=Pseudoalteromonas rhizosphaerae TaxID=2518973 RepID=UPI00237F54E6|nr:putative phage abortive infection protein [Pseudoalteromonas rhizosphaerae]
MKLIKNSFPDIDVQKKYSNILRAQLSNQELSLLLLNCLCPHVDNGQFRKLVIHFELLEHLDITYTLGSDYIATFTINNPTMHLTSNEIDLYFSTDTSGKLIKSAFGQNAQIISYCKDQNYIDKNI